MRCNRLTHSLEEPELPLLNGTWLTPGDDIWSDDDDDDDGDDEIEGDEGIDWTLSGLGEWIPESLPLADDLQEYTLIMNINSTLKDITQPEEERSGNKDNK